MFFTFTSNYYREVKRENDLPLYFKETFFSEMKRVMKTLKSTIFSNNDNCRLVNEIEIYVLLYKLDFLDSCFNDKSDVQFVQLLRECPVGHLCSWSTLLE